MKLGFITEYDPKREFGYEKFIKCQKQNQADSAMDIKEDLSDFDRVYDLQPDKDSGHFLILFSKKKQLFKKINLETKQIDAFDIQADISYQQAEVYDRKLFCVNSEPLTIDIYFDSKKQLFFHKRTIRFANNSIQLKEDFNLLIWMHQEAGAVYRCLLGPAKDGRYLCFDIAKKFFSSEANPEQLVNSVIFIDMTFQETNDHPHNVVCTMDENKKSVICFDKDINKFFEYNDFCDRDSNLLGLSYCKKIAQNEIKRMYCYYSYDYFTKLEQHRLKALARNERHDMDIDSFIRNKYLEILLCMEGRPLLKLNTMEDTPLNTNLLWKIEDLKEAGTFISTDIAINERTGEIYCLCGQGIKILKNSGRHPLILNQYMTAANTNLSDS